MVIRKRLLFWLLKAYLKRWGKTIIFSFIFGLIAFFGILKLVLFLIPKIPVGQNESIGVVGTHTVATLPPIILSDLSRGLTKIEKDGTVASDLAHTWEVKDNGKKYIFYLNKNIRFTDEREFTSADINYPFSDVKKETPDKYTVIFLLKESFSPFLTSVSKPILKNGLVGVSEYKVKNIQINGDLVQSITLSSAKNPYAVKTYRFYDTSQTLKYAFVLGEVNKAVGLSDISFKNTNFSSFPNVAVNKKTNYNRLITVFYDTKDSILSDNKLRSGLSYALPDNFEQGERSYSLFPPDKWAYSQGDWGKKHDLEYAKLLLEQTNSSSKSADIKLTIKVLPKYKKIAEGVARSWEKVDVKTTIETVDAVPTRFQIFLGDFVLPKDPDQYMLWHKDQETNITRYSNLRIDKLLEDGRKTTDIHERKKIYADFQKYLLADSPASFLYFPYEYDLVKK